MTSFTLARAARFLNGLLQACALENLDQGVAAALQDLGPHIGKHNVHLPFREYRLDLVKYLARARIRANRPRLDRLAMPSL